MGQEWYWFSPLFQSYCFFCLIRQILCTQQKFKLKYFFFFLYFYFFFSLSKILLGGLLGSEVRRWMVEKSWILVGSAQYFWWNITVWWQRVLDSTLPLQQVCSLCSSMFLVSPCSCGKRWLAVESDVKIGWAHSSIEALFAQMKWTQNV